MPSLEPDTLKKLTPFNAIADEHLPEIASKAELVVFPAGKMLFKRDDDDPCAYWLLDGQIDLLDEKFDVTKCTAGDPMAADMLDIFNPHALTAVSTTPVTLLKIARKVVGAFLHSASAEEFDLVQEEQAEEGIDWMSNLLSSPLFEFIPPANIQTLFSKFEEMKYEAGDVVIRQGDPGDYFYVIQSGRAVVERQAGNKKVPLATLKAGENFGQDALVSDVPRNATVRMTSRGTLMRLSEPDFESLLMTPVIETINLDEARAMVAAGDPKTYILDVRNPKEVENDRIDGSLNVPLLLLRKTLPKLKADAVYITAADGGRRSELGAYILNENGFTAYVLERKPDDGSTDQPGEE